MSGKLSKALMSNRAVSGNPEYINAVYAYNEGDENTTLTGGWSEVIDGYNNGTLTKNASTMVMSCTSSTNAYDQTIAIANLINLTNYTTAYINFDITIGSVSACAYRLQFPTNKSSVADIDSTAQATIDMATLGVGTHTNQTMSVNISSVNTSTYFTVRNAQVQSGVQNATITIKKIWLV